MKDTRRGWKQEQVRREREVQNNAGILNSIIVLCEQVFEPGRWSFFPCRNPSKQWIPGIVTALATPAHTELPAYVR